MTAHTDRPGKFLFGCLIVVLCWIIGAGQFQDSSHSSEASHAAGARQTSDANSGILPFNSFRWAIQHEPMAFYCFLASVLLWLASVVGRQLVLMTRDGKKNAEPADAHGEALWRVFEFGVSLVLLVSAGIILVRGHGSMFALLICVTTIVCYFLAYGPNILAEYFRELVCWLDRHYTVSHVNGDLPLGQVRPMFGSRLILPAWWWQSMRDGQVTARAVPAGAVLFTLGALVTLGVVALFGGASDRPRQSATRPNRPPTLLAIPVNNKTVPAGRDVPSGGVELLTINDCHVELGEPLFVAAKLKDSSRIDDVQFSLAPGAPHGARIDPDAGVIVWTPSQPGTFHIGVRAKSTQPGHGADQKSFAVVVDPSSRVPELADIPERTATEGELVVVPIKVKNRGRLKSDLEFRLAPGAPEGAKIDADSGFVTWKATRPGTYRMTVHAVTDAPAGQRVEKSFAVVVHAAVRPPELIELDDKMVNEGELLFVTAKLKDPSRVPGNVQFCLGDESPVGAEIDPDAGVIRWKPAAAGSYTITVIAASDEPGSPRDQRSFRVVVKSTSRPPVLARINDRSVNEGEPLIVPVKLKDRGQPAAGLHFSLAGETPDGASIDSESGLLSWTPTRPGTFHVTVRCESLAVAGADDEQTFTVIVHAVAEPPKLSEIGNKIVKPGEALVVPVNVADPGRPRGNLQFDLSLDSPNGAEVDPHTGVVRWTPDADAAAGEYPITVRVRNAQRPALGDEVTFNVIVPESARPAVRAEEQPERVQLRLTVRDYDVPRPLELAAINDQIVEAGSLLSFVARPRHPAMRSGQLEFSLAPGAPVGAAIDPDTGVFTWKPTEAQAMREFAIKIRVRDSQQPQRRDECEIFVKVNRAEEPESAPPTRTKNPFKRGIDDATTELPEPTFPRPTPADRAPDLLLPAEMPREGAIESDAMPRDTPPNAEHAAAFTNSIGMELNIVPDGMFLMGSRESAEDIAALNEAEAARFKDELPSHPVRISRPLLMGRHEVTVAQFREFVEATGFKTEAERDGRGAFAFNAESHEFEGGAKYNWQNAGWNQTGDHPVVNVSWNDALEFCKWLSEKEGRTYRLPTESEWEYACRAGTETRYASGETIEELAAVANLGDESFRQIVRPGYNAVVQAAAQDGPAFTTPAGKFAPNALGLFDMHGNVFEWCGDWYGSTYYQESPLRDPGGPEEGTKRVIRGGSFFNSPFYSRSSFRNGFPPSTRVPYLGFRVVMEVEAAPEPMDESLRPPDETPPQDDSARSADESRESFEESPRPMRDARPPFGGSLE